MKYKEITWDYLLAVAIGFCLALVLVYGLSS